MPTEELLLERMRNILCSKELEWVEKKMFGGDCFMVDNKMSFGTYKGGLMVRVAPEETEELLKRKGAGEMIHGGRPMKGYLFIDPKGYDSDSDLLYWIDKCIEFNPRAKKSKK